MYNVITKCIIDNELLHHHLCYILLKKHPTTTLQVNQLHIIYIFVVK